MRADPAPPPRALNSLPRDRADEPAGAPATDVVPVVAATSRLRAALLVGLASGAFAWVCLGRAGPTPDFAYWWTGARMLAAGENPYLASPGSPAWPLPDPLWYPMPALLVAMPIAWLPMPVAGALTMAIAGALLAWCVTREGFHRLWLFASAPYLMALKVGQWSPLILCAAFLPAAGWLAPVKPQIGLAALAFRPTWTGFVAATGILAVGFAVLPTWLADWLANVRTLESHPAPVATTFGPLLLLALLRWRRPGARVLLVMACVPQLLFFADQLPLWLVARSRRAACWLTLSSLAAFAGWYAALRAGDLYVLSAAPWVMSLIYLPALILVLADRERA